MLTFFRLLIVVVIAMQHESLACMPSKAIRYRMLQRIDTFGSTTKSGWHNEGLNGTYNPKSTSDAICQLNCVYDIESMLGFCRSHFVYSVKLNSLQDLDEMNIHSDLMRSFYENNVKRIQSDIQLSRADARKLAFATCSTVSFDQCLKISDSLLGNKRIRLSMGLTHKYSLEEAYIMLHTRPKITLFDYMMTTKQDWDFYINLIAGALNAITNGGSALSIDVNSSRKSVLQSVIHNYFKKFIGGLKQ